MQGGIQLGYKGGLFPNSPDYIDKMLHALLFGIYMEVQVSKDRRSLVVNDSAVILTNYHTIKKKIFQWLTM